MARTRWISVVVVSLAMLAACSGGGRHVVAARDSSSSPDDASTQTPSTQPTQPPSTTTSSELSSSSTTDSSTTTTTTAPEDPTTTTEPASSEERLLYMGRAKLDGDDPLDVWSAALDGSDRRIVVSGLPVKVDYYSHVAPSPDGNELAYVHRDDNRVHVWRLDTGADLVVSSDSAFRAYWLDDTTLAYLDANDEATHIVNADGSEDRALFPFYVWGATHDGRVIVQSSYDQLSVVTRDGDVTPVTEQEAYVLSGVLAPDGAHMAWTEASGCRCPSTVVRIGRPDGTESSVLPNDGAGGQSYFGRNSPSWADDETLYSIRPEVAIDRTRLDGDTVDVISFGGGYWDFLGVR